MVFKEATSSKTVVWCHPATTRKSLWSIWFPERDRTETLHSRLIEWEKNVEEKKNVYRNKKKSRQKQN